MCTQYIPKHTPGLSSVMEAPLSLPEVRKSMSEASSTGRLALHGWTAIKTMLLPLIIIINNY